MRDMPESCKLECMQHLRHHLLGIRTYLDQIACEVGDQSDQQLPKFPAWSLDLDEGAFQRQMVDKQFAH